MPERFSRLGPALLTFGSAASILYLWLRFFSPDFPADFLVVLSFGFSTAGAYFMLPRWAPRHERSAERLIRWNLLLALIGLASSLLWHILAAILERGRLYSLFLAAGEVSLMLQVAGHFVLTAYLILVRPTRLKLRMISAFYALAVLITLAQALRLKLISQLSPLLWVMALFLIFFTQDAVFSILTKGRLPFVFILAGLICLFIGIERFPMLLISEGLRPGYYIARALSISILLTHGGMLMMPLIVQVSLSSRSSQNLAELLTNFLAQQQHQTSAREILETTQKALLEIPSVERVYLRLRRPLENSEEIVAAQAFREAEFLRAYFRQKSSLQTYVETHTDLKELAKQLPAVGAILVQRPLISLQGATMVNALQAFVFGREPDCFEAQEITLITALIEQTAIFLEALDQRLYHEERLLSRKEVDFLRETREALLPPPPPIIQQLPYEVLFQQHDKTIGGDYYQIEEIERERLIDFWLSDCAGSGIAAAYQMAQARAILNALWTEKLPPETLIIRLNDSLRRVFHKNNFIAATYLRFDLEAKSYTLYRAGNPEILYWDPIIQKVELLRPPGVVLGNASSTLVQRILEPIQGELRPGATWLFFSDGFVEASRSDGEMFGIERIQAIFQANVQKEPGAIAQAIREAVFSFIGELEFGDDGTLIVVKYQP